MLKGYFNCSFQDVHRWSISTAFQRRGKKTSRFHRCLHSGGGTFGQCLPGLRRSCRASKVVVLKTIRYTMARTLALMKRDPLVKVIHLIRDPRGVIHSRHTRAERVSITRRTVEAYSWDYCRGVQEDLDLGDEADRRYPGRLLRVRYEDVALAPVPLARKLLAFAGLRLLAKQERRLRALTSRATYEPDTSVDVLETNSTAAAFAWRGDFSISYTSPIDASCQGVYHRVGYLPLVGAGQLGDAGVRSMLDTGSVPGFLS